MRSRVITGTASAVNVFSSSPQRAPHATLRPVLASASSAMRMRCSRVSSRKRWMRARRAAAIAAVVGVLRVVGLGERADHEDLLAIGGDGRRSGEPVVGQAAGEPAFEGCGARLLLSCFITSLHLDAIDVQAPAGTRGIVGTRGWEAIVPKDMGRGSVTRRCPRAGAGASSMRCPIPWRGSGAHLVPRNVVRPAAPASTRRKRHESAGSRRVRHSSVLQWRRFRKFCHYGRGIRAGGPGGAGKRASTR